MIDRLVHHAEVIALGDSYRLKDRDLGLVWTGDRARAWQLDFEARLAAARAAGGRGDPVAI